MYSLILIGYILYCFNDICIKYVDNTDNDKLIVLADIRNFLPYYKNIYLSIFIDGTCFVLSLYTITILSEKEINRYFFTWCFIMFLRSICFTITILPSPSCYTTSKVLFVGGKRDAIFSGHTVITILNFLILSKYYKNFFLNICLFFSSLFYSYLLLLTRSHYSVDIFLAYIITISIYINIEYTCFLL